MPEYTSLPVKRRADTRYGLNPLGSHRIDSSVPMHVLQIMHTEIGLWLGTCLTYDKRGVLDAVRIILAILCKMFYNFNIINFWRRNYCFKF